MSNTHRGVLVLATIVVLAGSLAFIRRSDDGGSTTSAATQAPSTTSTTPPTTATAPKPARPARPRVPVLRPGKVRTVKVRSGDQVRLAFRSPTADEVHVHGYDLTRQLEPGRTARLRFKARLEGIFEIELHGSHELIGKLEVRPR